MTDLKAWDLKQNSINPPLLASAGRGQRKKKIMTREEAKQLLPIIQAWAEGKDVQAWDIDKKQWYTFKDAVLFTKLVDEYRIKPEPKCRPFKDAEECWREMQKHQPFGWVKTEAGEYRFIDHVTSEIHLADQGKSYSAFCGALESYTFADGSVFGIKEE